jgi:hypothetical protein
MTQPPRSRAERIADTQALLESEVDIWVATADPDSAKPSLVPLSYLWDGETLLLSTPGSSPTGRGMRSGHGARLGLGSTRNVVLIDAKVETIALNDLPDNEADAFAVRTGFDPLQSDPGYFWFRARPHRILAWREENELADRSIMRNGSWLESV